jgi:hypothetical protein
MLGVIASRVVSALLSLPVFFISDAPAGAVPVSAVGIVLTLIGVALVFAQLRQPTQPPALP